MKAVAALVWSEWHARRWWLVILGVAGIAIALAMGFSLWTEESTSRLGWTVSVPGAFLVLLIAAFAVGFSMNYRDIAEYRLGFYLTKPLKGFALWAAKYAAGLGLVLIAGALLLLPTLVVLTITDLGSESTGLSSSEDILLALEMLSLIHLSVPEISALLFLTVLLLYSAAYCLGIGAATGSQWRALDVVAACALVAGVAWLMNLLVRWRVYEGALLSPALCCYLALPALVAAGAVAISRGRMQTNRIHRGLTLTLWPLVALQILAYVSYAERVFPYAERMLSPEMEDLVEPEVSWTETDSGWVKVSGATHWRTGVERIFLYNVETGRDVQIPHREFALSRDGRVVVWKDSNAQSRRLISLRLDDGKAQPMLGPLVGQSNITISPDGSRCAVVGDGQVTVYALPGFHELFKGPRPVADSAPWDTLFFFASRDVLRIYAEGSETWTIWEVDLAAQSSLEVGTMPARGFSSHMRLSADGRRVILWNTASSDDEPTVELRDGRSGGLLQTLSPESDSEIGWFQFLSDGRIIAGVNNGNPSWIGLASASGEVISRATFAGRQLWAKREIAPGRLLVATRPIGTELDDLSKTRLELVDPESGTAEEVGWGLEPLVSGTWQGAFFPPTPGSPASKLFVDPTGNLVFFDPLTGERETLLALGHKVGKE